MIKKVWNIISAIIVISFVLYLFVDAFIYVAQNMNTPINITIMINLIYILMIGMFVSAWVWWELKGKEVFSKPTQADSAESVS